MLAARVHVYLLQEMSEVIGVKSGMKLDSSSRKGHNGDMCQSHAIWTAAVMHSTCVHVFVATDTLLWQV